VRERLGLPAEQTSERRAVKVAPASLLGPRETLGLMKCAIHCKPGRGVAAAGSHPPVDNLAAEALGFILSVPEPAQTGRNWLFAGYVFRGCVTQQRRDRRLRHGSVATSRDGWGRRAFTPPTAISR
jgi:hypothetical protein